MRQASIRVAVMGLLFCALVHLAGTVADACTAFCAVDAGGRVLVGNNEDYYNPRTKLRFVPATPGTYGRLYVGFDDMWPQGGMNERGLWFDGFATPAVKAAGSSSLPHFPGNIVDKAMAECATVEEVVRLFSQYNRGFLTRGVLMFADAGGDAVSIEPDAMVRKTRRHFVQTNFHQSRPQTGSTDRRFSIATSMLERAGEDISVDLFRRILAETHQNGASPTLYSNVYDLQSRTMYLYYFHDFERVVTFNLSEELKKGERVLDIPSLFPPNAEAEAFAGRNRRNEGWTLVPAAGIAIVALLCLALGLTVFAWFHAGRRFRIGLLAMAGAVAIVIVGSAVVLHRQQRSEKWLEFSIGPASGDSTSINPTMIRSDGMTLEVALATAFDIPAARVIGPNWLGQTRYAITAVVSLDDQASFRSLLQEELKNRLNLQTHLEVRPFDVLVLNATGTPRLQRARHTDTGTWVSYEKAVLRDATMERLASALQSIAGRPVVDETGITGKYDLDFGWGEDRVASLTAVLHDRFGLRLSPEKREMEALIVDSIRRDAGLVLLEGADRLTRGAPPDVRRKIANLLTVR
jgi:uncharacterized protein (TIGR03435 family)